MSTQPSNSPNLESLTERVSQLEKKLEETLLMLSDVYTYGKLKDLLAAGKWQEADKETTRIMLEISGQNDRDYLTPEDVSNFPCNSLQIIDRLWLKYSNNRFGFSLQLQAYQKIGGNIDTLKAQKLELLLSMGDNIGWRHNNEWIEYNKLNFTSSAEVGGLPAEWWRSPYGAKMANYFFTRLLVCKI